jgi:hypothetical protein
MKTVVACLVVETHKRADATVITPTGEEREGRQASRLAT